MTAVSEFADAVLLKPMSLLPLQVLSIAEMGAYVRLLEYDNIEGMILLSELSRRRIRSITKLIKACFTRHSPAFRFGASLALCQCI